MGGEQNMANFRKLASGKWQARVFRDGKSVSIGTYRTKKEAEIEAAKVEERIYYGQALNDRNMTFGEVADAWFEHKRAELKDSTYEQLEVIVRRHIKPQFESKRIMKITRNDIKKWIQGYADDPNYSMGSCLKYLSVMKGVFHYAVHELEVLEKNP